MLSNQDHLAEEVTVCLHNHMWPFIQDVFVLIVENVFSLRFVDLSWNFTDGRSSYNMVRLNVCYACSPTSNALRRSLTIAVAATVPVDMLTRSDSTGDSVFSQLFSIISIRDLISQDDAVWKCIGLSSRSAFSGTRLYTRRSSSLLTAPGYKLNPLVLMASVCPCSPFLRSLDRQGFFRRSCWSQAE